MKTIRVLAFIILSFALSPCLVMAADPQPPAETSLMALATEKLKISWAEMQEKIKSWWQQYTGQAQPPTQVQTQPPSLRQPTQQAVVPSTPSSPNVLAPEQRLSPIKIRPAPNASLEEIQQKVKNTKALTIASPGQAPGSKVSKIKPSDLKVSKSGVPHYIPLAKLKNIKSIPLLDIGREPQLSANDFQIPEMIESLPKVKNEFTLASPTVLRDAELKSFITLNYRLSNPKDLEQLRKDIDQVVTHDAIQKVLPVVSTALPMTIKPFEPITEAQLKFTVAMILFERERFPIAMGLFSKLEKEKGLEQKARFYVGICAHKLKLYTEALWRLSDVVKTENAELAPQALAELLSDLPQSEQRPMADLLLNIKNKKLVGDKDMDFANYLMAKELFRRRHFEQAISHAEKVAQKSKYYGSAQYVIAISYHDLDKLPKASKQLENLQTWLDANNSDKNLMSLTVMTLARIRMKQRQFKEAQTLYKKVDKTHPYWIPALIEQGWVQLYSDDAPGAIGNMYSLHSPFFNSIYMPDSYAVRAIGYLNICQYGDAYRTIFHFEKDYRPWSEQVNTYLSHAKPPEQNYQNLKTYIRGKSSDSVAGLPPQILREVARRKDFLNDQSALNDKEDELQRYSSLDDKLKTEKTKLKSRMDQSKARLAQIEVNIEKAKVNKSLAKNLDQWRAQSHLEKDIILGYKYVIETYEEGRSGMLNLRTVAEQRLDSEKAKLRVDAGKLIVSHLKSIQHNLAKIMDNNEFLRYEVFAGSGENIRYQVAGGATGGGRIPASVKPEKIVHWDFDGEYWQDEIGNYRSSLQDNCPSTGKTRSSQAKMGEGE